MQHSKILLTLLDFYPAAIEEDNKLLSAATENNLVTLEQLLRCPRNPNATDSYGWTPLHFAALMGHMLSTRLLIEARATTDARDTSNEWVTPLMLAASACHSETVGLLLETDVDPDTATLDTGTSPLSFAAINGRLEVVELLLYGRADVDRASTDDGATPLYYACNPSI